MYKQMVHLWGSPMSPVIADLVLEYLEEDVLSKFLFKVPFYYRYVDDILICIPTNKLHMVTDGFNSFHPSLEFVPEEEQDGRIPFLDLLVIRKDDGKISTDWYHKETWSGRYLNFYSNLPLNYKRNTIAILARKIIDLSDEQFHQKNFELLRKTLINNKYPINFIDGTIKMFLTNKNNKTTDNNIDWNKICVMPYVRGLFEKIKCTFNKYDIKSIAKGFNMIGNSLFASLKDKTPAHLQSHLVYEIKCTCNAVYVGQTTRRLERRLYDHKYHAGKGSEHHSAMCKHMIDTGHQPLFDDTLVLRRERNKNKLDVIEMIEIKKRPSCINKQTDSLFLSNSYFNVLGIN